MPRLPASLGSWTARAALPRAHSATAAAAFHSSPLVQSHVGSAPVPVPSTVQIDLPTLPAAGTAAAPAHAVVRGPKGQLAVQLASFVRLQKQEQQPDQASAAGRPHYVVGIEDATVKHQRAVWGLTRALLANAVVGVSEGYTLPIRLVGVGYRAAVEDIPPSAAVASADPARQPKQRLNLKLGFAHPVLIDLPPDVTATTPAPNAIALSGIDKQRLGQVAAQIRAWRVPEPYNGKGIFVGDEQVRRKEVKKK
ncbi:hypothetical protein BMF94_6858 [Rhodotorula taiwanensis]|uniref:Large ribosomal subunit protein uL6 alpha-beta domain-containing protein n=5 Tax=Sporidiobolaceae TaxID=1799696 RepID=A0A2S5B032_9BASI|nr:hypothetical protein BMF94_6858 [Rhodotorula taiwanensis]